MKTPRTRIRLVNRQRQKLTGRNIAMMSAFAFLLIAGGFFTFFNLSRSQKTYAASIGDYRSKAAGNWNSYTTWEKFNGISWGSTLSTPTSSDGVITIQSQYPVTVTTSVQADQVIVDGTLTVSTGTLTIQNPTGTDLTVNGSLVVTSTLALGSGATVTVNGTATLKNTGTITQGSSSSITVSATGKFKREGGTMPTATSFLTLATGSTFVHAMNGGTIPTINWPAGSTCEITGVTTTLPAGLTQTFKSVTWNCPGQTAQFDNTTNLKNISENFTIISTGTGLMFFDQQGNNLTMAVGGDLNLQGGTVYMCENGSDILNIGGNMNISGGLFSFCRSGAVAYGNLSGVINLTGNLNVTGGIMDMSQYTGNNSGKGYGVIVVKGNVNASGTGLITETQNSRGQIYFGGSGTIQTYSVDGFVTNMVDYIINSGAIVRTNNNLLTSDGDFTLMSGGGLLIGSADGITQTAMLGNVQVTGTRTYSTGADYTYEGTAAQVTGNGLPATTHNLTLNNSNGLTMSVTSWATNLLTLISGKITTGSYEVGVTNTSTTSIVSYSSSNYVIGNLRRSVLGTGAYIYPLGTSAYYEPATLTLSAATGFTSVLGTFINANPIEASYPLTNILVLGTPVVDMLDYGYWIITPNTLMTGGTYAVTLNEQGYTNGNSNALSYTVLKRTGLGASWQSLGTHSNLTQSQTNGVVTAVRSAYTSFSHFGIGRSGGGALPIKLIYFKAKLNDGNVDLDWATAAEVNNNFFTVERSDDGEHFQELLRKPGAGNSTTNLYYSDKDARPLSGYSYYRLKQTDFDGHYTYSDIQTIKTGEGAADGMDKMEIKTIAPNPFTENFKLSFMIKQAVIVDFSLMNASGQLIVQEKIQAEEGINTYEFIDKYNLKKGIYYVTLVYNDQRVTQKIIKN